MAPPASKISIPTCLLGLSSFRLQALNCCPIVEASQRRKPAMIHTANKDVITRTEPLMRAFGWQGGTIHQLAHVTGCDAYELIYSESIEYNMDNKAGWFAYRTNSLDYNQTLLDTYHGNLQFWLGVAGGVQTSVKSGQETPRKF